MIINPVTFEAILVIPGHLNLREFTNPKFF